MKAKHDAKTREVNDYKKFKIQCLDLLRVCCAKMGTEFGALTNRTKRAETLLATKQTRSKELDDASGAVARELEKASALTDRELVWLRTRELSRLPSAAAAGRDWNLNTAKDVAPRGSACSRDAAGRLALEAGDRGPTGSAEAAHNDAAAAGQLGKQAAGDAAAGR